MKDVMLDFETFGNGKNALVVQLGACYFNRLTGDIESTLAANIDPVSAQRSGGEIDAQTIRWWMQQSPEAIQSVIREPTLDITLAFNGLNEYLSSADCIWSHATFDFVILSETLKRLHIKPTFRYQAARDIRTLVDLSGIKTNDFKEERKGIHHNALDDCKHQVRYCVAAFNALRL